MTHLTSSPVSMDLYSTSTESERLIAATKPGYERESTLCTPTRFSVATLFGIVVILTATIFVLLTVPQPSVPCKPPAGSDLQSGGYLVGILADVHLDLDPESSCPGYNPSVSQYGIFGCDATVALVNKTLVSLSASLETHDSVVVFLGDAARHQPVETWDPRVTLTAIKRTASLLGQHFPRVSVLPSIGNNDLPSYYDLTGADSHELFNQTWYSLLLRHYEPVITADTRVQLGADFRESFLEGGYYSVTLANGITVISLNTNQFSANVPDRALQDVLAKRQLAWLQDTLYNTTGRIMIIGHHPPGLALYTLYSKQAAKANWRLGFFLEFRALCTAVSPRLTGAFFGHVHQDSFSVERDPATGEQLAIFSLPSVSPVYQGQPSYGVAELDASTHELRDLYTHHTWLDYYGRSQAELQFFSYRSVGSILAVDDLRTSGLLRAAEKIIDAGDGLRTFTALKNKIYQDRTVPLIPPYLYYCYSTNLRVSSFILCAERYGYDGKVFVINS